MYLGIEIGGTKLQLGVGRGDGSEFIAFERIDVDPKRGAEGILEHIETVGRQMMVQHPVEALAFGFGGPVNSATGHVTKSHQIAGWDGFPIVEWCRERFGLPVRLGNDCDCAALAEARFGAGRGASSVFYVTVGTGVGGGFVVNGELYGVGRPAVAEIGHLRPGLKADRADMTVESIASGRGIEAGARACLAECDPLDRADLMRRCENDPAQLTARDVAMAAEAGNQAASRVIDRACQALGWGIAQVISILAVEAVVVGGGVSLAGEKLFLAPLRREVRRYVFPPLADSYQVYSAGLGELVVVHGALALAASAH
ncbi:MAG: ROK family protein [Planctomycetaceae bacterium]